MEQLKEVEDVSKRRKRTSLRRWKARCWLRLHIPEHIIVEYNLTKWFHFIYEPLSRYGYMTHPVVHNRSSYVRQLRKRQLRLWREIDQWKLKM